MSPGQASEPPVRSPRQARSEETRSDLIEAVLRLLRREGRAAVTHRAVAREAGVSLSATSYYFASKEEMLAAAYLEHTRRIRKHMQALVETYGWRGREPARPALDAKAIGRVFAEFVRHQLTENRDEFLATVELQLASARDPELRARLGDWQESSRRFTADLVKRAGSTHPMEDAEALGALVNGLALDVLARGADPDHIERLAHRAGHLMTRLLD